MRFAIRGAFPALVPLAGLCLIGLAFAAAVPAPARGQKPAEDDALKRTRAQVKMLDDLFKVAVVDITNRYDGPPAAKVAKTIFTAAKEKHYFDARLLDATGSPQNEANVPVDDFEKSAAKAMIAGKTYFEQVVQTKDGGRRLRVATVVPAVVQKCAKCHGVKQGDLLGFLSYDVQVQ